MEITFRITGREPGVLMHNPAKMRGASTAVARKKIPSAEDEAEQGAYRMESGQLYLKADMFREASVNAAKFQKIGKEAATAVVRSTVFVLAGAERCGLVDPETGAPLTTFEVDVRRCVVQRQGVLRARPLLPRWQCDVTLEYDPDYVSAEILTQLMEIAGRRVGVGDYRPTQGGPFGRFAVERLP